MPPEVQTTISEILQGRVDVLIGEEQALTNVLENLEHLSSKRASKFRDFVTAVTLDRDQLAKQIAEANKINAVALQIIKAQKLLNNEPAVIDALSDALDKLKKLELIVGIESMPLSQEVHNDITLREVTEHESDRMVLQFRKSRLIEIEFSPSIHGNFERVLKLICLNNRLSQDSSDDLIDVLKRDSISKSEEQIDFETEIVKDVNYQLTRPLNLNNFTLNQQDNFLYEVGCMFADPIAHILYSVYLYSMVKASGINLATQSDETYTDRAIRLREEVRELFKVGDKKAELLGEEIYILSLTCRDSKGAMTIDSNGSLRRVKLQKDSYDYEYVMGSLHTESQESQES